jgi:undecaprenyl diphosphate synthase
MAHRAARRTVEVTFLTVQSVLVLSKPAISLTDKPQTAADASRQVELKEGGSIPRHIACIMDGNGRWAQARGLPRVAGHREGVVSVRDVVEASAQLGVDCVTLYTFSTENWQRPAAEVSALMELLVRTLRREVDRLQANDIRLRTLGDLERLPARCAQELREAEELTRGNGAMILNLALSYSGRWELTRAVREIAEAVHRGEIEPASIDEDVLESHLGTAGLPDPDLLIRTGGERRISNFLLWQLAYTEIYVSQLYWPDFRRDALYAAIEDFQRRERRFGRVPRGECDGDASDAPITRPSQ